MATTEGHFRILRGEINGPACNMFLNELLKYTDRLSLLESSNLPGGAPRPLTLPDRSIFLYAVKGPESDPIMLGSMCLIIWPASSPNVAGLPPELDEVGEIKRTIVLEEHRQRGVAGNLIEALEGIAKDEFSLKHIVLETLHELKAAQGLYQKAGYRRRAVYGAYDERQSLCYEKRL